MVSTCDAAAASSGASSQTSMYLPGADGVDAGIASECSPPLIVRPWGR